MRKPVSLTEERTIAASPAAVWSVISDPVMHERLDPRCRLGSTSGTTGEVGSRYELTVRAGALTKVRLQYDVVEAEPEARWAAAVSRDGRPQGEQRAEMSPSEGGTLLRWTVTMMAGGLTCRLAAASGRQQLRTWLAAVEREASSLG